ncbi:MAG: hypothetical protein BRD21_01275 [Halobacteriales archaeon SW_8_66_22]|nr:MAG: hypothetical protein BRD21_01275 [Halobacteriales archaeon SW_8_66_22]
MDEAAATRRAALDAVDDVEPDRLHERITKHVQAGSMVPGVLTILSVRAVTGGATGGASAGDDTLLDAVERRAAGVQLIYDGLRLTRQLSHDEPWTTGHKEAGDLDVLVADVLVARGFYLLSRTTAADTAVETVRAFGHDQTVRETHDVPELDRNLEADVVRLAIVGRCGVQRRRAPRDGDNRRPTGRSHAGHRGRRGAHHVGGRLNRNVQNQFGATLWCAPG